MHLYNVCVVVCVCAAVHVHDFTCVLCVHVLLHVACMYFCYVCMYILYTVQCLNKDLKLVGHLLKEGKY